MIFVFSTVILDSFTVRKTFELPKLQLDLHFFPHIKSVYINNYTKILSLCISFRFDQCYGHFMDQSFTQLNEEIGFFGIIQRLTQLQKGHT